MTALARPLAALLVLCASSIAAAEPTVYNVDLRAAITADAGIDATILVGSAGQLYRPSGSDQWRREAIGGVAIDLRQTIASSDTIYAVAEHTPMFRHRRGSWHVSPLPNRGSIVMGVGGGVPSLAIGKHVYLLRKQKWVRQNSAKRDITALWAASTKRVYVGTASGEIKRLNGRRWNDVTAKLGSGDRVVSLLGIAGKQLLAITRDGLVLEVGATTAKPLVAPANLTGFDIRLSCPGNVHGAALLLAATQSSAGDQRLVLIAADAGKLTLVDDVDPAREGDEFTILATDSSGAILLASRRGEVRLRDPSGQWRGGVVVATPPTPTHKPTAGSQPAPLR
jgi:hypothetical protein